TFASLTAPRELYSLSLHDALPISILTLDSPAEAVSRRQLHFLQTSSHRVNILEGAIRSGKTIIALLRWFLFLANAPRGGELLMRSEEHTSELQSRENLVCRLLLEK